MNNNNTRQPNEQITGYQNVVWLQSCMSQEQAAAHKCWLNTGNICGI